MNIKVAKAENYVESRDEEISVKSCNFPPPSIILSHLNDGERK